MKFKKTLSFVLLIMIIVSCSQKYEMRKISAKEYRSKMKAGWLGQMSGVGWGATSEFKFNGVKMPIEKYPKWEQAMVNQQFQDDLYVEMTFIKSLEDYGFGVSIRQAGIDFANSKYQLWHANKYGRDNLRAGIAPPYSGHPKYSNHSDDIDYQIEADYSGLISPGMTNNVISLGEKFGRIMNYGDGLYGGIFIGAMYSAAFFEKDINKILAAGLSAIPKESQYAEAINDVIKWHTQYPDDWDKSWDLINNKFNLDHNYRKFSCNGTAPDFNIDAKINGAFVAMGLLYGNGDMDKTIRYAMRCGMDADCNPSSAAGVLATSLGLENLPDKYKTGIDDTTKFSYTAYNFPTLLSVCENLTRDAIIRDGGLIEKNSKGEEVFLIPKKDVKTMALEQSWNPSEIKGDIHFSEAEMKKIVVKYRKPNEFVNSWNVSGPFSKKGYDDSGLFNIKFPPEVDKKYSKWQKVETGKVGYTSGSVNLLDLFGANNSVAYLKTEIFSKKKQNVLFEIGSDDGVKVWVNRKIVHSHNINRGHNPGDDIVPVKLKKGWNKIMMKVTQGTGGWEASLAITDLNAKTIIFKNR